MVIVWVVEALQYVGSKLLQLIHRQIKCLHQLIILYFLDVLAHNFVMKSIAHDVDAREVCNRRKNGVRTIEQGNLSLMVWSLGLSDKNVQTSLVSGELSA